MISGVLDFFRGYRTLISPDTVPMLNLLREFETEHRRMRRTADGGISFSVAERDAKPLIEQCAIRGITVYPGRVRGLPGILSHYRGRVGIGIGAVLFAVVLYLSSRVVWQIEITGNKTVSDAEIIEALDAFGFGIGTPFRGIDFDVLQNDFLLTADRIAWIAINMHGTVARIEVRENLGTPRAEEDALVNIVAAEDGQILEVNVSGGRSMVSIHDTVRAGDLLISGVLVFREDTLHLERAGGRVYAAVNRTIDIRVPLEGEDKRAAPPEITEISVKFFRKEGKVFRKGGITPQTYDTIIENKRLYLFEVIALPIWIETTRIIPYESVPATLSEKEAITRAEEQYNEQLRLLLQTDEILSIETERYMEDGAYHITSRLICRTDIAREAPITVNGKP